MSDMVSVNTVIGWMNTIRNLPENQRYRALESFWDTQLASKLWILKTIKEYKLDVSNVYIFGGWTGVLSSLLLSDKDLNVKKVYSIDIDPWCKPIAESMCIYDIRFAAICDDMKSFNMYGEPSLVINTSTEHVSQEVYNIWYDTIPANTNVIIQGNNFFSCKEHVRCSKNVDDFMLMNRVKNLSYSGELPNSQYTRFMSLFAI